MSSSPLSYEVTIPITKNWTVSVPGANGAGANAEMNTFVCVVLLIPSTRVMFAGTPSRVAASRKLMTFPF